MSASTPVLDAIAARRSPKARDLADPAPPREALLRMVQALAQAPDHGRLVPFRLIEITPAGRARLADALAAQALEGEGERAREKASQGAMLLAMVVRIDADHPKITASDQWLAAGAALENFLLAAQAQGFGVAIRTGRFLEDEALHRLFGLAQKEQLGALLALGTPTQYPPAQPKPEAQTLLARWGD